MIRLRPRLPGWTAHPGFGVAALFAIAILLIVHGEPQPSSRPSGKSVVVTGSPSTASDLPAIIAVHDGQVEVRRGRLTQRVVLPTGAIPRSVTTNRGLSIVLAAVDDRQRAYAVTASLSVRDLGYADAVLPAVAPAALLVESAVVDPGRLDESAVQPSATARPATSTVAPPGPPDLRDFVVRRFDAAGRVIGDPSALPIGMRAGADTRVGLVVWQPTNRVYDGSVALEPLSARAMLVRPDGTERTLGPVYPLAATSSDLLVWDVVRRQFGLMPLAYVTSTATTTATATAGVSGPTASDSATRTSGGSSSTREASPAHGDSAHPSATDHGPTPTATPTAVAGTTWFDRTRGFSVTGPASFSPDGRNFAVYAQVGARRRLVVAQVSDVQGNQVEVLALSAPIASATPPSTEATTGPGASTAATSSAESPSATTTAPGAPSSVPVFAPDGYPIRSASMPLWSGGQVLGVGPDGTVVTYTPGSDRASLVNLDVTGLTSLAAAP